MFALSHQLQQSWHSQQSESLGMLRDCDYSFERRPKIALSEGVGIV